MKYTSPIHADHTDQPDAKEFTESTMPAPREFSVSLLTGGIDRPYVFGLTNALSSIGVTVDLIGSDELDEPDLDNKPGTILRCSIAHCSRCITSCWGKLSCSQLTT